MRQWVEAGAGSGKTTDLIAQVIQMLRSGQATLPEMVAITFTEKAAGELKLRLREQLEKEREKSPDEERERLERAILQMEESRFQTVHGFCQELLQERPLEARIDPLFTVLAGAEAERLFQECFHDWFQLSLQNPGPGLARFLRRRFARSDWQGRPAGYRSKLLGLAARLREHRHLDSRWQPPPAGWEDETEALWAELQDLERQRPAKAAREPWNKLVLLLREADPDRESLLARASAAVARLAEPKKAGWNADLFDWGQRVAAWRASADASLLAELRQELEPLLQDYQRRKASLGRLDFLDLLLATRDLLRGPLVESFRERHRFLFVDEFQDTDPMMAEIIDALSAAPAQGGSPPSRSPLESGTHTGKEAGLYVVGDPKQAIYRFRGGDLAVYRAFQSRRQDLDERRLTDNWRSVPELVEFFNRAFQPVFDGDPERLQASFTPMQARRSAPEQRALYTLPIQGFGQPDAAMAAGEVREQACRQIAAFLDWLLRRSGHQVEEQGRWRPVQSRDVCILLRAVRSNLEPLCQALERYGLTYLTLSGRGLHQREEVQAARVALEAVEWPLDALSVFAALRGPLFGLDEHVLSAWHKEHRHFNPLLVGPEQEGEVARALRILAELHGERNRRSAGETLERLLSACRARIQFALGDRGAECLANLGRLSRLAWTFESRGASSFRAFVEHLLEQADSDSEPEGLGPDPGVDGVRIVSVHSSKGLEFPVVVLGDPGSAQLPMEVDEVTTEDGRYLCGIDRGMRPWGFAELALREEAVLRAECDRLAYVAATRARDLLVIPQVFDATARASWMRPLLAALPEEAAWDPALARDPEARNLSATQQLFHRKVLDPAPRRASEGWRQEGQAVRARAGRRLEVLAARSFQDTTAVEVVQLSSGPSGLELGLQLHRVLALLPWQATREEVEGRAGPLAERVWAVVSSPWWRPGWRELPLSAPLPDGRLLEGVADLVFADGAGYTVVDFKTDGDRAEYRAQLSAYAWVLGAATGAPVRAVLAIV